MRPIVTVAFVCTTALTPALVSTQQPVAPDVAPAAVVLKPNVSRFNFGDRIILRAASDTMQRWPSLRVRRFQGTRETISEAGAENGDCFFYGAQTFPVVDGTGELYIGFADTGWLRRQPAGGFADATWVLVFEDGSTYGERNLLIKKTDVKTYFSRAIDITVMAAGAGNVIPIPAASYSTVQTSVAAVARQMSCARTSTTAASSLLTLSPTACD